MFFRSLLVNEDTKNNKSSALYAEAFAMNPFKYSLLLTVTLLLAVSCAVMPENIRKDAQTAPPFPALLENPQKYAGMTVILGGYILQTKTFENETRITVLQTPLDFQERPKDTDSSEGRFMVVYQGFLDPEVYAKDRLVTVGGVVAGSMKSDEPSITYTYPLIQASDVYLWPKKDYYYNPYFYNPWWFYPPYPYYYPFFYPYPYPYYR